MNFIRYYNQNRREIIIIIVVIIIFVLLLQLINRALINNIEENNTVTNETNIVNETSSNTNNVETNETTNTTTSSEESTKTISSNEEAIEVFISYLNNGNTTKAYEMLTDECKEEMYPSVDLFIEGYYDINFDKEKIYEIYEWTGSTYKVDLKENALYTGKTTDETKQDYITVVKNDGEYKLNINNYIGRSEKEITQTLNNLEISIIQKDTYMSYEIYTLKIKNNSDTNLILDDLSATDTIYITDDNGVNYIAYMNELTSGELEVYRYSSIEIEIKFMSSYTSVKSIESLTFSNAAFEGQEKIILSITI